MNGSHTSIRTYAPKRWLDAILTHIGEEYWNQLITNIDNAYATSKVYPPRESIFTALEELKPEDVKVVILGQDPYHGPNQAHGLSFSVPNGQKIPPSLRNIYKEISRSLGCETPSSGNLEAWSSCGVLLLNSALTVEAGKAGSHSKLGWHEFTDAVFKVLSEHPNIVYMLWGNHAQTKESEIDASNNLILKAPHPSPLSAHKGFIGCDHFLKANTYLVESGREPVNWCLSSQTSLFSNQLS